MMPQLRTHCVLCSETIFRPRLNSKILTDWKQDCLSSFCETFQLDPSCLRQAGFCVKCEQILREINFIVRSIERFQKKLRVLTTRATAILLINSKQLGNETHLYSRTVKKIVSSIGHGRSESTDPQRVQNCSSGAGDDVNLEQERKDEPASDHDCNYQEDETDSDFNHVDQDFDDEDSNSKIIRRSNNASKTRKSRLPRTVDDLDPKTKFLCGVHNCNAYFYCPIKLHAHVRRVHEKDPNPYHCNQCSLKFKLLENFQTHGRKAHGIQLKKYPYQLKKHPCPNCEGSYSSKGSLNNHISEQHAPAKPRCNICTKTFDFDNNGNELETHVELHNAIRATDSPFSCVICNSRHINVLELQDHVLKNHEEGCIKCHIDGCDEVFLTKTKRNYHLQTRHPTKDRSHLVCRICSYQATAPIHFRRHMLMHDPNKPSFTCDLEGCRKYFSTQSTLKRHLRTQHGEGSPERSFKCNLCPKAFNSKRHLSDHQACHFNHRPFLCEHCSLSFKTLHNLRKHFKVHEDGTPGIRVPALQKPRKPRLPPVQNIEKSGKAISHH